jgi:hypothetical protein
MKKAKKSLHNSFSIVNKTENDHRQIYLTPSIISAENKQLSRPVIFFRIHAGLVRRRTRPPFPDHFLPEINSPAEDPEDLGQEIRKTTTKKPGIL